MSGPLESASLKSSSGVVLPFVGLIPSIKELDAHCKSAVHVSLLNVSWVLSMSI